MVAAGRRPAGGRARTRMRVPVGGRDLLAADQLARQVLHVPLAAAAPRDQALAATTRPTTRRMTPTNLAPVPIGGALRGGTPVYTATPGQPRVSPGGRTFPGRVTGPERRMHLDRPLRRAIRMSIAGPVVRLGPAPPGATFARATATCRAAGCSAARAPSTSPAHEPGHQLTPKHGAEPPQVRRVPRRGPRPTTSDPGVRTAATAPTEGRASFEPGLVPPPHVRLSTMSLRSHGSIAQASGPMRSLPGMDSGRAS